jgi:acetyl-CoA decarbonylase/synthase complex subunit gamma
MALTALDIYKHLPKSNCGECGVPTCLAFAMKLAQKQASLDQCPQVTDDAKAALEGAAAPPIRLVTVGAGDGKVQVGNETVLFRHEETFHHQTGLAVAIDASLPDEEIAKKAKQVAALAFERVGQHLQVNLIALRDGGDPAKFASAARIAAENAGLPLVLSTENPEAMQEALKACADGKPLLHAATEANAEQMAGLAKEHGCALAVKAEGLEALSALAEKVAGMGVQDLVLDSTATQMRRMLADQTFVRRAALKKRFRPLGYPTMAFTSGSDPYDDVMEASTYIAKYAGIVVLQNLEPWQALALLTVRQNIYTDPQKPIQMEAGIYEVGTPDEKSPVLVTTNFSLTYFTVESDIEASKVATWVVVVDTEGLSVLTAWAADKFTAENIAQQIKQSGIEQKVKHRKVVIPGGVAVLSGKLEEESGWNVLVGPRESSGIPSYLRSNWQS